MSANPSTFSIGNFVLNYIGSRMQSATYKGASLDSVTQASIQNACTTGNRTSFELFSNEVFDTIADLDTNYSMYELSIALTNAYFEKINGYFNQYFLKGLILDAQAILIVAIQTVQKWEDTHTYMIHKGTPYSFLGNTYLVTGNLDLGLTIIHDSLTQDTYTYPRLGLDYKREAPAYLFATLNVKNPNNMFLGYIQEMKKQVENAIASHNAICGTAIQNYAFTTFSTKFLERCSLESVVFYFVYTLLTMQNLEVWDKKSLANNSFARLKQVDLLFNISLLVDKTLSEAYQSNLISEGVLAYLDRVEGIREPNVGVLNEAFKYSNGKPIMISKEPLANFLPSVLSNDITYRGFQVSYRTKALLAAWNVRNFSAHNLTGIDKLLTTTRYEKIFNLLMSALFFSTEVLP